MLTRPVTAVVSVVLAAALGLAGWNYYRTTRPDYRLRAGREALRRGDLTRGRELAVQLETSGHPDPAHFLRAEALYRQARAYVEAEDLPSATPLLREALDELDQIRDEGELRVESEAVAGQCQLYLQNLRAAEAAFLFVLARRPDHVDAHRGLAALYYDLGALARAVGHLERVAELDSADSRPHRLMGLIFKDLDQRNRAIDCYQEALRRGLRGERTGEARLELAEVLVKQARYAEGLEALAGDEDLATSPARLLAVRAECLMGLRETAEARRLLDEGLVAEPRAAALLLLRSRLHLDAGNFEAAAALLERAMDSDPHDPVSRHQLGKAYAGLGRLREADEQQRRSQQIQDDLEKMTRLNQAADAKPWDAAIRQRLAELAHKLGKHAEAAMWEEAAAACNARLRPPVPAP
jgi:tetratricopeptide (TPR) repeat protein